MIAIHDYLFGRLDVVSGRKWQPISDDWSRLSKLTVLESRYTMAITRPQLVTVLAITMLYLVGQLAVGTNPTVASLFSAAILFGLLAVFAGGGLTSAFGCLNAVLIAKFLLLGIAIKIALLQPADSYLSAPVATASVMAIGFFGLCAGTLAQSRLSTPRSFSLDRPYSDRMLLSFSIVLFVFSYCCYFAAMIPSTQGEGLQTGGWLGIARAVASLKSLSVVPPMLYLWRKGTSRWMTHPVIVVIVVWAAIVGVFSTNKQDAMEPLAFYFLVGFLRYGWRDIRLWGFVSAAAFTTLSLFSPIPSTSGMRAVVKELFKNVPQSRKMSSGA